MYGVSKINIAPSQMMISVQDVAFKGNSLARYLQIFADTGVVVDMISQSAPHGTSIDFSFTAASSEVLLITTSDLDISLLVHAENEDAAYEVLHKAFAL